MKASRGQMVFVQSPYVADYGPMRKAAGTYFPLGVGYLSSFIRHHGFEPRFFDPNVQDLAGEQLVERVLGANPMCVGISFMTPQIFWTRDFCRQLKAARPGLPIVLGGAHPSVLPAQTLADIPDADYVIHGEGEETLLELLQTLADGGSTSGIAGLAWRASDGIRTNPARDPVQNLDALPFPDRQLMDQSLYHAQSFLSYSPRAMTIHTSRGCPGRCVFCASGHILRSRIRERSIANVMDEIDWIRSHYRVDYLLIKDDTFTLRKSRVEEFCAAVHQRHPGLKWHCMVRVNTVDEQLLSTMKHAGLNDVFLGIESGNNDILKTSGKGITTEQAAAAVHACSRLGVKTYGAFILGLPGDTRETMEQTIRFACSLPLTMAGFSILIPYPGTRVFEEHFHPDPTIPVDYHRFIASSGIHYAEGYSGIAREDLEALPGLVAAAQKRFYLRPRQLFRILASSNPSMWLGAAKGFLALCLKDIYLLTHRTSSKEPK